MVILGCGRSGTSILGELFEEAPGYDYRFEPALSDLRTLRFADGPVAMKVPKDATARSGTFTPGLPFDLDELVEMVPAPRALVWIVRHPLDVICSLRPGISADWAHRPRPVDYERWLDRPLLERCARHWENINGVGHDRVRDMVELVRYEDVVFRPVETGSRVLRHAGLGRRTAATIAGEWAARIGNRKGDGAYEARHQDWLASGNQVRVGRWQTELSRDDVERIRPILGKVPAKFGYEIG